MRDVLDESPKPIRVHRVHNLNWENEGVLSFLLFS